VAGGRFANSLPVSGRYTVVEGSGAVGVAVSTATGTELAVGVAVSVWGAGVERQAARNKRNTAARQTALYLENIGQDCRGERPWCQTFSGCSQERLHERLFSPDMTVLTGPMLTFNSIPDTSNYELTFTHLRQRTLFWLVACWAWLLFNCVYTSRPGHQSVAQEFGGVQGHTAAAVLYLLAATGAGGHDKGIGRGRTHGRQ
jgi:hypothetical protein